MQNEFMISENAIIRNADYTVIVPELMKSMAAALMLLAGVVALTAIFRSDNKYAGIIGMIAVLLLLGGSALLLSVMGAF